MMEELNDLNYNAYLARAIEIFNEMSQTACSVVK